MEKCSYYETKFILIIYCSVADGMIICVYAVRVGVQCQCHLSLISFDSVILSEPSSFATRYMQWDSIQDE